MSHLPPYRKSVETYCLPIFHEKKQIVFEDLVHPLLNHPTANSGEINKNSVITGPMPQVNLLLLKRMNERNPKLYKPKSSFILFRVIKDT